MSKNNRGQRREFSPNSPAPHQQLVGLKQEVRISPIPDGDLVEHWERVLSGSANRILSLAENAQKHEQAMASQIVPAQVEVMKKSPSTLRWGQIFAFASVVVATGGAVWCAIINQPIAAAALGLAPLTPIVGHFLKKAGSESKNE